LAVAPEEMVRISVPVVSQDARQDHPDAFTWPLDELCKPDAGENQCAGNPQSFVSSVRMRYDLPNGDVSFILGQNAPTGVEP
jgi:hypothetical protein